MLLVVLQYCAIGKCILPLSQQLYSYLIYIAVSRRLVVHLQSSIKRGCVLCCCIGRTLSVVSFVLFAAVYALQFLVFTQLPYNLANFTACIVFCRVQASIQPTSCCSAHFLAVSKLLAVCTLCFCRDFQVFYYLYSPSCNRDLSLRQNPALFFLAFYCKYNRAKLLIARQVLLFFFAQHLPRIAFYSYIVKQLNFIAQDLR